MKTLFRIAGLMGIFAICGSLSGCAFLTYSSAPETDLQGSESETENSIRSVSLVRNMPYQRLTASLEGTTDHVSLKRSSNVMHDSVVGGYGSPLEIVGDPGKSVLTLTYDPDSLGDIPPENLMLLHYNDDTGSYDPAEETELDKEAGTLTAEISEDGTYVLVDVYTWLSAWGIDLSDSEYAHDASYTCTEYGFSVTLPKEVRYTVCSDYLHDSGDGSMEKELLYSMNDADDPLQFQLLYKQCEDPYEKIMTGFLKSLQSEDTGIKLLSHDAKEIPGRLYADFLLMQIGESYQYSGFYQLTDNTYIFLTYSFSDLEAYQKAVEKSLYSYRML